ncbi:glycosyltransferase [Acanthopleuribacter pedis]|uniref:Glycosyltransferase n=1 Tax=Acanthopleuribacter pedis TaxID=442870 RepID=A0A8J7PZH1_9BACT|nr:glycosyltransferase [Acanthopleuribacter pedis]MBO1317572.1 glycosyltransferase [Acanthopleuribacter pedis]
MSYLIIVPTYNHAHTVESLGIGVLHAHSETELLFIDQGSHDQTTKKILQLEEVFPDRVHHLVLPKSNGWGHALLTGYKWGVSRGYPWIFQMAADFSHHPVDLQRLIVATHAAAAVVGSRFIEGSVYNDPSPMLQLKHHWARFLKNRLGLPMMDVTSSFVGYSRDLLERMPLGQIQTQGRAFDLEMKIMASHQGATFWEVPISHGRTKQNHKGSRGKHHREWLWVLANSEPVPQTAAGGFEGAHQRRLHDY